MKTLITLIAAACLVGTAFGQQPNPSPTPGPEHKKLEIWVGDWTYEIVAQASPLGPASTFTGKNTARPIHFPHAAGGAHRDLRRPKAGQPP